MASYAAGKGQKPCLPLAEGCAPGVKRIRRRSLDQVIEIVEQGNLSPEEQKLAAKLRRLLNDTDRPEAD